VTGTPRLEEALAHARAALARYREAGEAAWAHSPGGKPAALRHHRGQLELLRAEGASPLLDELERLVRELERLGSESCTCFEPESFRDDFERTMLGHDRRGEHVLAEVSLDRCRRCGRIWLHYFVEDAEVPESSRWYRAPLPEAMAQELLPGRAAALLESVPWRLQGGAFHGRRGRRVSGPAALD
jgi:hypothetical protein